MESRDRTAIYVLAASILTAAVFLGFGGFFTNTDVEPHEAVGTMGRFHRGEGAPGGIEKDMAGEISLHSSWIFELRRRGFSVDVALSPEQDDVDAWDVQAIGPRGGVHQARGSTPEVALGNLVADITGGLREAHLTSPLRTQGTLRPGYFDPNRPSPQARLEWLLILREQGFQIDVRPQLSSRGSRDLPRGNTPYAGPEVTFTAAAGLDGGPQFAAEGATPQEALGNMLASLIASLQ